MCETNWPYLLGDLNTLDEILAFELETRNPVAYRAVTLFRDVPSIIVKLGCLSEILLSLIDHSHHL